MPLIIQGLSKLIAPILLFLAGAKNNQAKIDKADAKILKKQRDNDITNTRDADSFWLRKRKDK